MQRGLELQINAYLCTVMKKLFLLIATIVCTSLNAQERWKFQMETEEGDIVLNIDLYEESVDVPGMSMFGPMNGYLGGKGVYGVWMVTSYEILSDEKATLHLSNDLGSETQHVRLTLNEDSTCLFEQTNGNVIKKAVNNKLVKIPAKLTFKTKR